MECAYTQHNLLVVTFHKSASGNEDLWSVPNYVIKCNFQRTERNSDQHMKLIVFINYFYSTEVLLLFRNCYKYSVSDVYSAFICG
jgi:hypothetical protein